MISHYTMLAGYNAWCNERLYDAAAQVSDADYRADRGAFFKSLHGTLNHLLVGDRIWMHRFTGAGELPSGLDAILYEDFAALRAARRAEDKGISRYVGGLSEADLAGSIRFRTLSNPATHRTATCVRARPFFQSPDPSPRPGARLALEHDRQRGHAEFRPDHLSARNRARGLAQARLKGGVA